MTIPIEEINNRINYVMDNFNYREKWDYEMCLEMREIKLQNKNLKTRLKRLEGHNSFMFDLIRDICEVETGEFDGNAEHDDI